MQPTYPTHPPGPAGALGSNPPLSPPTLAPTSPLPIEYGGSGASNTQPPGALRFFGTDENDVIAWYKQVPQRVLLASLAGPSGVWYPNQWIGPSYALSSGLSPTGYAGLGFYRVDRDGVLSRWAVEVAYPTGTSIDAHVYVGPSPDALSFSGVVLTVEEDLYVSQNLLDELEVAAGDCISVLNGDPVVGFTPSALSITADFTAYP